MVLEAGGIRAAGLAEPVGLGLGGMAWAARMRRRRPARAAVGVAAVVRKMFRMGALGMAVPMGVGSVGRVATEE